MVNKYLTAAAAAALGYLCSAREAVNYRSCLGSFSALFDGLPASLGEKELL